MNTTIKVNNKSLKVNKDKRDLASKLIGLGFMVSYNLQDPDKYKLTYNPDPKIH